MELLEKRLAPAGIIAATLSGGVLKLIGDGADNDLKLDEQTLDTLQLSGLNETLISFNGATPVSSLEITNVTKGVVVDLKEGADTLSIVSLSVTGDVNVQLGPGNNGLNTEGEIQIGGNLTIGASGGADSMAIAAKLVVGGQTAINLGDGDNYFEVADSTPSGVFGKGLSYTGGSGLDSLFLRPEEKITIGGPIDLKLGAGPGDTVISAQVIDIKGGLNYVTLAHTGSTNLTIEATILTIGNSAVIKRGDGSSSVSISGGFVKIAGDLTVVTGSNVEGSANSFTAASTLITGNFSITNGAGFASNTIAGSLVVGGNLTITNGISLPDTTTTDTLALQDADIGGSLKILNQSGNYNHEITAVKLHVGKGIAISHDTSASGVTLSTYLDAHEIVTTSVNITSGAGTITNYFASLQAVLSGGITMKGGNAALASTGTNTITGHFDIAAGITLHNGQGTFTNDITAQSGFQIGGGISIANGPSAGVTNTTISGPSFDIQKGIVISNGNGAFRNTIDVENLTAGGTLAITNGNIADGATTVNQIQASAGLTLGGMAVKNGSGEFTQSIAATHLAIRGGLSVSNGLHKPGIDGTNTTVIAGANVTVGGLLKLTSGGGDTQNTINGGLVALSGLSIANGDGNDTLSIATDALTVRGKIQIVNADGNSQTQVTVARAGGLSIRGGFSVNAGMGDDSFTVAAEGTIAGRLNTSFGLSETVTVSLRGGQPDSQSGVLVLTAPFLAASAAAMRVIDIDRAVIFGPLNFTGGTAEDTISINNSLLRGAVTLDLLAGEDLVDIRQSTFLGTFTFFGGAGADYLDISTAGDSGRWTEFQGAVQVRMGDGDDQLRIGDGSNGFLTAFYSPVLFDGNAGANILQANLSDTPMNSDSYFIGGPPVIMNFPVGP